MKFGSGFAVFEVLSELDALRKYLASLESHLAVAPAFEEDAALQRLRDVGDLEDDDLRADVLHELDNTLKIDHPRLFRGSFLVVLWAVFESSVHKLANVARERDNHALSLDDIYGNDFLEQSKKYFEKVLDIPLADDDKWESLKTLQKTRNAMAHHAGRLDTKRADSFKDLQRQGKGPGLAEHRNTLVPSKTFSEDAMALVEDVLKALIKRT